MTDRSARRLAWSLWALVVALALARAVLAIVIGEAGETLLIALGLVTGLGYATVGALIASRHRGNAIGWLFLAIPLSLLLSILAEGYARVGLVTSPGSLPTTLALWLSSWVFFVPVLCIPLVFLLYPTGRVHSPRWRALPWTALAFAGVAVVPYVLLPGDVARDVSPPIAPVPNPTGIEGARDLLGAISLVAGWDPSRSRWPPSSPSSCASDARAETSASRSGGWRTWGSPRSSA